MTLRAKLTAAMLLVAALGALATVVALLTLMSVRDGIHRTVADLDERHRTVQMAQRTGSERLLALYSFAALDDSATINRQTDRVRGLAVATRELLDRAKENARGDGERQLAERIMATEAKIVTVSEEIRRHMALFDAATAGKVMRDSMDPLRTSWLADATKLDELVTKDMVDNQHAQAARLNKLMALLIGAAVLSVVAGIAAAVLIGRSVSSVVTDLADQARRIGEGDLTRPVLLTRSDELGQLQNALAAMQGRLRETTVHLAHAAQSVGVASQEIAQGNKDLSSRTEQQASSLQQTAASMEQLNSSVKQSLATAQQASSLATGAASVAEKGG